MPSVQHHVPLCDAAGHYPQQQNDFLPARVLHATPNATSFPLGPASTNPSQTLTVAATAQDIPQETLDDDADYESDNGQLWGGDY